MTDQQRPVQAPDDERIVAIEDTLELRIDRTDCVRFEARGVQQGAVSIRDVDVGRRYVGQRLFENFPGPPGQPDSVGLNAANALSDSQSVASPRRRSESSYAAQFPTRYLVVNIECTLDFIAAVCDSTGRRHQPSRDVGRIPRTTCTNAPTCDEFR